LKFFALRAADPSERDKLTELAGPSNALFMRQNLNISDVLEIYRSVNFKNEDMALFIGLLKQLFPRYYSISSSPNYSKGIVRITYKVVKYYNSMNKRREGVSSSFLATRKHKDVLNVRIQKSTFKMPEDPTVPMIMIGAGTGVTPFVGFTEERLHQKTKGTVGKSVILYGCSAKTAMIEADLWEKGIMDGILDRVITAFSKETPTKLYVQDQIVAHFDTVWNLIESGACIYSCGDVKVGLAVKETLIECISKKNKITKAQATEYIQKLQTGKRYFRSEWGLQESPNKTIAKARFKMWVKSVIAVLRFTKLGKKNAIKE